MDFWEQGGQRTGRRRFGRTALTANQDAADAGVNGIEDQGAFHTFLPDDGGEGVNRSSGHW